ncbi:unnamed protein product [Cuscuta campestris]|uniref:Integrase catalytic domain-containing protein n=1 Tax=Cuscuta campestris TaxID=132261 RepID=A0A484LVK6_9ASTE|nr:unnamed protein product [Cuscuta campestris]
MVHTRSNANVGTGVPQQGENSATGGRHPPITTGEAEALIQRVGITSEQFKEVLAALAPNREVVVGDVAGGPIGEKAGPAGSQGKKKKVRRSQKKKATKPNGKAMMADALSRLEEEDESSSFERMSAFDRLGDPKSKKPRTSAFERLQDTRSARKGDLRDTLKEKRGESTATSKAVFSEVTPFSRRIMSCPLPDNFKTPQIKAYNGTTDPQDHLARFGANVVMYAYPEEIKCRCFLATLEGQACEWFHKLPKGSIDKWGDLAHKFLEHFASSRRQKLPFSHLLNVKIRKGEQLREFINRWEKEARDVQGANDQALIAMLQAALPQGDVRKELRRNPLSTYQEMLARAKYLALEEEDDEPPVRKEKKSGPPVAEGKKRKEYGKGPNPTGYHANRHPVHAVQSLPAPPHGRESYGVQDAPKYCEYHRNSTHNTSECVTLKKEMDQLIARGPPARSERPSTSNRTWRRPPAPTAAITTGEGQEDGRRHLGRDCDDLDEEERQGRRHLGCRFIMGGNTGGDSVSSRKKWKNMVYLVEVQRPPLPKRKKKEPLIFTDEDYPPVLSPHRDALVIRVEINNVVVHRTLVDTGSSVNVMYSNTFKELGLSRSDLKPIHTPLSGFTGDTIEAEGTITVKAGVGDGTHRLWVDMEFMVVQLDCAHHLILGRPGLEDLECVISPVHLCLKFNTPTGVGVAKGNQSLSRSCYVRATKSQARVDENIITDNGTQFEAGGFNEFLQSWGIKHSYAAVGYPQTNGQVENTNRTIMDGLKKKIMECKSAWVEEVPYILWTYRTTPRKATGETPFSLTYGFEARAPAETSLLSYRVETFDAQGNEENLRAELHLIDERRERAYMRAENYRRQVKSYHDQRVRPRQFKLGDWVLRKREVSRPTGGGKFAKSFEGPYIIKEVLADGTFRLQTPTGGDVPRVWNAANLIKFYQ